MERERDRTAAAKLRAYTATFERIADEYLRFYAPQKKLPPNVPYQNCCQKSARLVKSQLQKLTIKSKPMVAPSRFSS